MEDGREDEGLLAEVGPGLRPDPIYNFHFLPFFLSSPPHTSTVHSFLFFNTHTPFEFVEHTAVQ
jgi:hypothetical protein